MTLEIDLPRASDDVEPCSFTMWLPLESADLIARRRKVALAEEVMTALPAGTETEIHKPAAPTFLNGPWL